MKEFKLWTALALAALVTGCSSNANTPAQPYEWEIVPLNVGGQSDTGSGGAFLLNKRTGEVWGTYRGGWGPTPRYKSLADAPPEQAPSPSTQPAQGTLNTVAKR